MQFGFKELGQSKIVSLYFGGHVGIFSPPRPPSNMLCSWCSN